MSQDQPIDNSGFVLCTWDNGVVQQGMYLAKSATMDEAARDARALWDIPPNKRVRFFMDSSSGVWEIAPGSWSHAIRTVLEIIVAVGDVIPTPEQCTTPTTPLDVDALQEIPASPDISIRDDDDDVNEIVAEKGAGVTAADIHNMRSNEPEYHHYKKHAHSNSAGQKDTRPITPYASRKHEAKVASVHRGRPGAQTRLELEYYIQKSYRCDACQLYPKRECQVPRGHPNSGRCEGCWKSFNTCTFDIARGKGFIRQIGSARSIVTLHREDNFSDEERM